MSSLLNQALARLDPDPDQQGAPVFVVGAPRSGTSMLAWALAEHTHFATSFEADFMIELFAGGRLGRAYRKAYGRADGWLAKHQVSAEEFCAHLGSGFDQLYRSRLDAERWIDATPRHVLMGPQLALLFPRARFLHIIRDGRDAVDSMIHSGFQAWSARSFVLSCLTWVRYVRRGQKLASAIPGRVQALRYEHLVGEAESWREIFEFLAEDPQQVSADFVSSTTINSSFGCSNDANGEQIQKPSHGKPWNGAQRMIFKLIAGPLMAELGYGSDPESAENPVEL